MEWIDNYVKSSSNPLDLHAGVLNRMLYIVCTTAITGYFNPYYNKSFHDKISEFEVFMSEPLVDKAMISASRDGLNLQRKIILLLVKYRLYCLIAF